MATTYAGFDALCLDGSDASFDEAIAFVATCFDQGNWAARGEAVRGLTRFATTPPRRARIVALLCDGLETALHRGAPAPGKTSTDANVIGVAAAAVGLGRLGAREAEALLRRAFTAATSEGTHFALNQTAGALGVALATIAPDVGAELAAALHRYDAIWGSRSEFVNLLRYATWVATGDERGALAWLLDDAQPHGRPFAAAALADLDAKGSAAALGARLAHLDDQHARTAVAHALRRLASQDGPPAPGERMIFGLPLWHPLEPADEFPALYRSLLDEVPPEASPAPGASAPADLAILAKELFALIAEGDLDAIGPHLPRLPELAAARDDYDRSLVHEAICQHHWEPHTLELALAMIEASDDVNTTDQAGNTPLHDAATRDPALVEALVAKGARTDARNHRGETPLAMAEARLAAQPDQFPDEVRTCIAQLREAGA